MGKKEIIIRKLKDFRNKLKENVDVKQIIFFGSRASGRSKKDSDIDLVIVSKDFEGKRFRYRPVELYEYWELDYPVDFLCYTPEEFNKLKNQVSIIKDAVETGIIIE